MICIDYERFQPHQTLRYQFYQQISNVLIFLPYHLGVAILKDMSITFRAKRGNEEEGVIYATPSHALVHGAFLSGYGGGALPPERWEGRSSYRQAAPRPAAGRKAEREPIRDRGGLRPPNRPPVVFKQNERGPNEREPRIK